MWEVISRRWHSALDTATEKDIQKALQHLAEGRSSLAIAHRLSVRGVCAIYSSVLADGIALNLRRRLQPLICKFRTDPVYPEIGR